MGYIAKEISTNRVYFSKGANKISEKIGCNYSTITKFFKSEENKYKEKVIKGFIVSKTIDLNNQSRGISIKFFV